MKMCIYYTAKKSILASLCIFLSCATALAQSTPSPAIDLQKALPIIHHLDSLFSQFYLKGDSVALYNMYAKDASFGSLKGNDILLAWGRMIRNSIGTDTRNLIFTTTSLAADAEFLVELGQFKATDGNAVVKGSGKYVVVWKKENGQWKLYRDIGL